MSESEKFVQSTIPKFDAHCEFFLRPWKISYAAKRNIHFKLFLILHF